MGVLCIGVLFCPADPESPGGSVLDRERSHVRAPRLRTASASPHGIPVKAKTTYSVLESFGFFACHHRQSLLLSHFAIDRPAPGSRLPYAL